MSILTLLLLLLSCLLVSPFITVRCPPPCPRVYPLRQDVPSASPGGQHFYFVCPNRSLALATVLRNSESTSVTPPRPDDLTSLELKSRYVDVLQYFLNLPTTDPQLQKFNEQYTLEISLLLQRLPSLNLNRCYVSTSNILKAGNGLFSSRDISVNELITLFPADAVLYRPSENSEISSVIYPRASPSNCLTSDAARAYEIRASSIHSIVGDPELREDAAYLGHIANDASMLTSGSDKSRLKYSELSVNNSNSYFEWIHEKCCMGLYAVKDIKKCEEVYVSYGEGYWVSRGGEEIRRIVKEGDLRKKKIKKKKEVKEGKGFKK